MFGIEFSLAAAINLLAGGLLGVVATMVGVLIVTMLAEERFRPLFKVLEIVVNLLIRAERLRSEDGRTFEFELRRGFGVAPGSERITGARLVEVKADGRRRSVDPAEIPWRDWEDGLRHQFNL